MSVARIKTLLPKSTDINEEKKPITDSLSVHKHQQEIVLKHVYAKQTEHEAVLENLQSELEAIKKLGIYLEHIRITSELFRGTPQSYQISEEEMKDNPDLLREYKSFHAYLDNAMRYINQLDAYLKTKPPISNDEIQTSHHALKKEFASFKSKSNIENLLEKYNRYDKTVLKILTHCERNSGRSVPSL